MESKITFRGEAALMLAVIINSFGVVLMLYSGAGISAISSVPYAFSEVLPKLTLMIMRRKFVPSYLFSFVVGFVFGELLDFYEWWIHLLPYNVPMRIVYFVVSYLVICVGIALSNRCGLPIIPTDLFPRELSDITRVKYSRIKIGFDITCLAVTAGLTFFCLGHIKGLGIGTVLAAFTMGKGIALIGGVIDKKFTFANFLAARKNVSAVNS